MSSILNFSNNLCRYIQGDSRGKENILENDIICDYKEKIRMNMCIILNVYRESVL